MSARVRDREQERRNLRAWRAANPERAKETTRRNEASRAARYRANPSLYLWRTAKNRAKQLGQPFDIEPEDVVVPEFCPITGVHIDVCTSNYHNGASLDRVVNELGYVKGNVRVISRKANRLKGDATLEEAERVVAYMKGEI